MAIKVGGSVKGSRPVSALLFSCLLLAGAAAPTVLWAQEEQQEEEGSSGDALSLLRAGNDAFEAGQYMEAYDYYSQAYELFPESTILYRMGQSAQELLRIRVAISHYEAYLETADDEERKARINDELLPALRAQIPATVTVATEPEGAIAYLVMNKQEIYLGPTPDKFEVYPGQVEILVRLEGYQDGNWEGDVEPDSTHEVAVELVEAMEAELPVPDTDAIEEQPLVAQGALDDQSGGASLAVLGWSTTGMGVALLATGGVLSFMQADATKNANEYNKRADGASRDELESLKDKANSFYRGARGTYIAGGILTAAGVGILTYEILKSDKTDSNSLSFEGGISPRGEGFVGVRGRF